MQRIVLLMSRDLGRGIELREGVDGRLAHIGVLILAGHRFQHRPGFRRAQRRDGAEPEPGIAEPFSRLVRMGTARGSLSRANSRTVRWAAARAYGVSFTENPYRVRPF